MRARQPCCWMQKASVAASSACLTIEAMSLAVSIARAGTRLNWLMVTRQASRFCLCPNCLQATFSPWVTWSRYCCEVRLYQIFGFGPNIFLGPNRFKVE